MRRQSGEPAGREQGEEQTGLRCHGCPSLLTDRSEGSPCVLRKTGIINQRLESWSPTEMIVMATGPVKQSAASPSRETLEERFQRLATIWHRETDYLSSMSEASNHPAYQEIIRLGPEVIPLLLRDLEKTRGHWFAALSALTGAQPIAKSLAGNIPKMTEAWLRWAKDNGYRW
jgi:hypothetical protein